MVWEGRLEKGNNDFEGSPSALPMVKIRTPKEEGLSNGENSR